MCAVSMVGDFYRDQWQPKSWFPDNSVPYPNATTTISFPAITREEFDELKRQVEEMKELLKRAKLYDEMNGEPECEVDEKMDLLRRVANLVGISLDDVLGVKNG